MIAFLVGLAVGISQFFLLKEILKSILEKSNTKKLALLFVCKFLLYGAAIALVFTVLRDSAVPAGIGLAAGMPGVSLIYFIFTICFSKKGDVSGEHSNNN